MLRMIQSLLSFALIVESGVSTRSHLSSHILRSLNLGGSMKLLVLFILSFFGTVLSAYDCSTSKPFIPFEYQSVSITVQQFYWVVENGTKIEKTVPVCTAEKPLEIGVYDIRGREEEWYYCFYQEPRPMLNCNTSFRGKPSQITVRPAIVIRKFNSSMAVRDTHAHVFLVPEGNDAKYFDTFVRSALPDLKKQTVFLDSVSGGRGPDSDQDSYGVRLQFN